MPRLKDKFALCRLTTEGAEIMEKFTDHDTGVQALTRERSKAENGKDKYKVVLLPLSDKGDYLLPP